MSKPAAKAVYLDGIRGTAAFLVFFHHFSLAFYIAYFNWDTTASHLGGAEIAYGKSVFSVITNGNFCVNIFFVLSGFVLSRKYFHTGNFEALVSGFHRRFLRLYIPVAFTLVIAYVLMVSKLFFNGPVSQLSHSGWFACMWAFPNPGAQLVSCLTYTTMFQGDSSFDTSMWTLSFEFYGSLFVFAFFAFTHFTRYRVLMLLIVFAYFYVSHNGVYVCFIFGMSLCYTERYMERKKRKYTTFLAIPLLLAALALGSYPSTNVRTGTFFEQLGHTLLEYSDWYHTVGAYLLVLAFVLSPVLQRIAGTRALRFMGYISFSLYLLHPLVMGSFSSWLFLALYKNIGYNPAVSIVFFATLPVLFTSSWLMAKYVDAHGINAAKKIYTYLRKNNRPRHFVPGVMEATQTG